MADKKSKKLFNKLKRLTPTQRQEAALNPDYGKTLLMLLTPTQYADLFPDYFRRGLPDVSGFREAITRKSQAEQQKYFDDIDKRLGSTSPGGKTAASGGGVPNVDNMTAKERNFLGLVLKYESGNRNIPNFINDKTHTAQGFYQLTNTNWRNLAPKLGITASSAMEATKEEQTRVALALLRQSGEGNWTDFNPALRSAVAKGEVSTYGADVASAGDNLQNVSKRSSAVGGFYGGGEQCVDLAKHFSGLGAAGNWKVGGGKIVPGTVIATQSYNDGSGGKMARDMPDGQSHYHTGIALTVPDANGNVLILDQYAGRGAAVHMVNINNYNGEKWGVVAGGEASASTMKAVDLGKSLADPGQLAWINQSMGGGGESVSAKVDAVKQEAVPPPSPVVSHADQKDVENPGDEAKAAGSPLPPEKEKKLAGKPQDTATVNKPEPADRSFNVNREALISAIKQTDEFKNTFGSSLASDEQIYSGFLNDPRTQKIMQDTKTTFDQSSGVAKIGDYKKFRQAFPDINMSKIMSEVPPGTPAHAGGGREKVKGPVYMSHLHKHYHGDTAMVTDARGKRFTVNPQKERITVNPKSGMMDIKPFSKEQMDVDKILALIRRQESGSFEGNYSSDLKGKGKNTASGAYQYNDRTWKAVSKQYGIGTVYKRAIDAPKHIQDHLTKTRVEDLRKKGYTDQQIFLTHFTGNKRGIMAKGASAGNPTPHEYISSLSKHAEAYDKTGPKVAAAQNKPPQLEASVGFGPEPADTSTPSTPKVEPAQTKEPAYQRALAAFGVGESKAQAEPVQKAQTAAPSPDIASEHMSGLREDIRQGLDASGKQKVQMQKTVPSDPIDYNHQNLMSSYSVLNKAPINPAQKRFQDNLQQWSGDHFSLGNKH